MTEPRHGDPLDYPDIPGDSGLGDEYRERMMPPHMRATILKRRLEIGKIRAEATAGRTGWLLIEHDGAIYRGFALAFPQEVWSPWSGWRQYADAGVMKPVKWGSIITEAEALKLMLEWAEETASRSAG